MKALSFNREKDEIYCDEYLLNLKLTSSAANRIACCLYDSNKTRRNMVIHKKTDFIQYGAC